jgi:hypothetical protein
VISGAAVGLAVTFVALYVYTAALRVTYPFDLEWEEGAFMDHVLRVVHGDPIYVRPSLDFTPFIYTPGYYYVGAAGLPGRRVGDTTPSRSLAGTRSFPPIVSSRWPARGQRTFARSPRRRSRLCARRITDGFTFLQPASFRQALETKRFDLVIQDTPDWFPVPIGRHYHRTGLVAHRPNELWPPTGNHVRPEFVYEPRQ